MKPYTSIDPSAIDHATSEQQRHEEFKRAAVVVREYCEKEGMYCHISLSPPQEPAKISVSSSPPLIAAKKRTSFSQPTYEAVMAELAISQPVFNMDMLFDFASAKPEFKGLTVEAVESAIKRSVNKTRFLERTKLNGVAGYVQIRTKGAGEGNKVEAAPL